MPSVIDKTCNTAINWDFLYKYHNYTDKQDLKNARINFNRYHLIANLAEMHQD